MSKAKPCQHTWSFLWHSGTNAGYQCTKCQENKTVPADREFKQVEHRYSTDLWKRGAALHKTWFAFEKKFQIPETEQWRWRGYSFIEKARRWAKGRKDVQVVRVDDDYFSSSVLVLIEHATPDYYMGLHVVVIPQCAPDPPVAFFLYPRHAAALFCALRPSRYRKEPRVKITKLDKELNRAAARLLKKHLAQE